MKSALGGEGNFRAEAFALPKYLGYTGCTRIKNIIC